MSGEASAPLKAEPYAEDARAAIYRVMAQRRDVRQGFLPEPLPDALLTRLLAAAHSAPSVGLMQPTRFLVVRSPSIREAIHAAFLEANRSAAERYAGERRALYDSLKLEAILQAPQNLCILCDSCAEQGHGLGRQTMPETAVYSTVCAVQNLWLAARAEGVGVGWVSIVSPEALRPILQIPSTVTPRRLSLPGVRPVLCGFPGAGAARLGGASPSRLRRLLRFLSG